MQIYASPFIFKCMRITLALHCTVVLEQSFVNKKKIISLKKSSLYLLTRRHTLIIHSVLVLYFTKQNFRKNAAFLLNRPTVHCYKCYRMAIYVMQMLVLLQTDSH